MINGDFHLKDGDNTDYKDVEVSEQDEEELLNAINGMISRATKNLPEELRTTIINLVIEFEYIFRTKLDPGSPNDVPPMVIKFEGDERSVKVRQRT